MILSNTKATGYSLGLPLWWPNAEAQLSTGWLQGISLVVRGTPRNVYLTRYQRSGRRLDMVFSTDTELLCSLTTIIGTKPNTYQLTGMSDTFIDGYVTFYGPSQDTDVDLSGAQVCPKYITFVADDYGKTFNFTLAQKTPSPDSKLSYTTVDTSSLQINGSADIDITDNAGTITLTAAVENIIITVEDTNLYTINGVAAATIEIPLPEGWVVSKVSESQVKIGVTDKNNSCPDANYIDKKLNSGNFTRQCPLEIAFVDGHFDLDTVMNTTFNPEYENDGHGLAWNEFSSLHDSFEQG